MVHLHPRNAAPHQGTQLGGWARDRLQLPTDSLSWVPWYQLRWGREVALQGNGAKRPRDRRTYGNVPYGRSRGPQILVRDELYFYLQLAKSEMEIWSLTRFTVLMGLEQTTWTRDRCMSWTWTSSCGYSAHWQKGWEDILTSPKEVHTFTPLWCTE